MEFLLWLYLRFDKKMAQKKLNFDNKLWYLLILFLFKDTLIPKMSMNLKMAKNTINERTEGERTDDRRNEIKKIENQNLVIRY